MRCKSAQELIALMPSGDATPVEARAVADHIEHCTSCGRLAVAEPLPLGSLRTVPPLREGDYAAVRARVLAGLGTGPRRFPFGSPFRLAAAMATLATIVVLGVLLTTPEVVEAPATLSVVEAPSRPAASIQEQVALGEAAEPDQAAPTPQPAVHKAVVAATTAAAPTAPRLVTAAAASETIEDLRIQIQTSDPDVRIIWIVNPTFKFEQTFLEEES